MSKRAEIEAVFRAHRGRWVSLPALLKVAPAQYRQRISEMRHDGAAVECKSWYVLRGPRWERQTAYRLV